MYPHGSSIICSRGVFARREPKPTSPVTRRGHVGRNRLSMSRSRGPVSACLRAGLLADSLVEKGCCSGYELVKRPVYGYDSFRKRRASEAHHEDTSNRGSRVPTDLRQHKRMPT
jgi:hypothetical protein